MTNFKKFINRYDAGIQLAEKLHAFKNKSDAIVLALPRGGVPVAYEIAKALQLKLDLLIVRKLGVPEHEELAFGAIGANDVMVLNDDIINELNISPKIIEQVKAGEKLELLRREKVYRKEKPFPDLQHKTVILVDDGIATGATIRAAISVLSTFAVKSIIVAVPVIDKQIYSVLSSLVDKVVSLNIVDHLIAVGNWYEDFSQTEDEEVFRLL